MPTLAQVLQGAPRPPAEPHLETVVSANATTVQTASGPVVNAIGSTPANGKRVIVWRVEGVQIAIAALP